MFVVNIRNPHGDLSESGVRPGADRCVRPACAPARAGTAGCDFVVASRGFSGSLGGPVAARRGLSKRQNSHAPPPCRVLTLGRIPSALSLEQKRVSCFPRTGRTGSHAPGCRAPDDSPRVAGRPVRTDEDVCRVRRPAASPGPPGMGAMSRRAA